jgi:NAD-dependent DNA ligase/DNA polymerase/3'-5' exonuclease PolX
MPKGKKATQKKGKLIIESSTTSSEKSPVKAIRRKKSKKVGKKTVTKKRKLLIIESSSSTPLSPKLKEKIEFFNPEKNEGISKTDLKISQDIKQMSQLPTGRLNEKFIELMEKLADIMLKQGEQFRARAYQKAQETIMAYPGDIMSPNDLKGKPGIGSTIMEKLNEYVETGTLKVLEREKNNPVNILAEVYGIGPKKAKELVENGITSIAQLRENQQMLNDIQKVGLRYYEDVLKRIPRSEIEEYKSIFESDFNKVATSDSKFEIVGSYRRGAQSSGDIDVIITSDSPRVFINFIDELIKKKIILEILSRGPTKCLVMAKIPSSDSVRRVDFLYTGLEEFPFAILYFTGSKIFNTVMRHIALENGYTMNEHGINKMEGKKKGDKVDHHFTSEKDIFDFLGLEYKAPTERTDGRAIILKTTSPQSGKLPLVETKLPLVEAKLPLVETKLPLVEELSSPEEYIIPAKKVVKKVRPAKTLIIESDSEGEDENIVLDKTTHDLIDLFKKNGISHLKTLNENQLTKMLNYANVHYRNLQPIMTDNQYDILEDYISDKYPANEIVHQIGAPVERNKVTLPYQMGSMDKIKPDTSALANWMAKYRGPYVLSCKLDGVSGLYTTEGPAPKLYTRGDGKVGQDVSHLIPHLRLPKTKGIVIRGEFIIPKAVFDSKYKTKFANPRNMVAGIINHKTINEATTDLNFVSYEVIVPVKKPSEQMEFLSTLDVEIVLWKTESSLTNELLSETLVEWRKNYVYEIDGVIVTNDAKYTRKAGNPDHSFAFKMVLSDQIAEGKVVDVIWSPSKDGYLKPRVQIEPINLGGVRIEFATGFNGAFINDNKVGVGAVIELIRSGDVIPHIRKVTVPADQAKMPSVPFKWNDTHVDVMLEDLNSDETVKEKNITGFFRGIGVEGLSSGNVARIIQAGYDSVPEIIKMEVNDLLQVEGFKDKTANKLYNGIKEKIDAASLVTIMSASNMFGRGFSEKKLELIMDSYPNVLLSKESNTQKVAKISAIKGMAEKTSEAFVERIPDFINFIKEAGLVKKMAQEITEKKTVDESHPLFGKTIVMTGFRDAQIQEDIKNVGAKLGSSVSKNTFIVLVKNTDEDTGKAADARKLGVPLMTPEDFVKKYL